VAARVAYNKLPGTATNNSEVIKWESYLVAKEDVAGVTFVNQAAAIPSVSAIEALSGKKLDAVRADIQSARASYTALADVAKKHSSVSKWESFLGYKEEAAKAEVSGADAFVANVRAIANISAIEAMNEKDFAAERTKVATARVLYNRLSDADKADDSVMRWVGYLTEKEEAVGLPFINEVKALASLEEIAEMDEKEAAEEA